MVYRYVPLLRWKRGERTGLKNVSAAGAVDTVPLFIIGSDQIKGKAATKSKGAQTAADVFAKEIYDAWGARPFGLDASALTAAPGTPHPIQAIAASCNALGATLIPATSLTASLIYQTAVAAVNNADQRGVILRVDLQELNSAANWFPNWTIPVGQTDLVADFADIVGTVANMTAAVIHSFQHLHNAGQWRTVTTAGTSMPENFGGFLAGLHTIPRDEVRLWTALANAGLPYRIDFGDYATPPIAEPPPAIAWGYPINVRYTLPQDFLICRGVKTTGFGGVDMEPQLIGHAKSIVAYPQRNRINCWADDLIDQIAATGQGQGNLETWVQIAINRHVELVRSLLP
ncbi:beta family protein [Rhodopseudomonas palustris]|uniref:beta family protein n=1 Tax=Rhodopseudomonas palustris TaxID=1076 RepID=UPI0021F2FBF3|nr:beta family protein [Rhodopseudomonas palustris]UYO42810.1 beta family protein [Rhodopseudomonas palustris]